VRLSATNPHVALAAAVGVKSGKRVSRLLDESRCGKRVERFEGGLCESKDGDSARSLELVVVKGGSLGLGPPHCLHQWCARPVDVRCKLTRCVCSAHVKVLDCRGACGGLARKNNGTEGGWGV